MKLTTLLFGIMLSFFSSFAIASGGHDHGHGHSHGANPVNQATAKTKATKEIADLVKRNKLDKSWEMVSASSVEKRTFKGSPEWIIIFMNEKISDKTKQKLYVFLTLSGEFVAANYTGN